MRLALILLLLGPAASLRVPCSRRAALFRGVLGSAAALAPGAVRAELSIYAKGSDERCESGEGAACERMADGNELISKLQQQSRLNKGKNERKLYDQTVRQLQYSDYFDTLDKNLVMMPDGKYKTLDMESYTQLRKEGRIQPGSVDAVLPEGQQASYGAATAFEGTTTGATGSIIAYGDFKESLAASKVEGVVFKTPSLAYAVVGGGTVRVELKAKWQQAETRNMCSRLGIPTNAEEVL